MAGPFVSNDNFEVIIKYVEKKNKAGMSFVMIVSDKETEERYKGQVKVIHTQWIQPNWKESNELARQCTKFDPIAGERLFDWGTYRSMVLERYMKSWDIVTVDANGQNIPVPCIPENINRLDPSIAGALIDGFYSRTQPSEESLGN
jgi:hypothetical protein